MEKLQATQSDILFCDCLSCRLQFSHNLSIPPEHPVEVIYEACYS